MSTNPTLYSLYNLFLLSCINQQNPIMMVRVGLGLMSEIKVRVKIEFVSNPAEDFFSVLSLSFAISRNFETGHLRSRLIQS